MVDKAKHIIITLFALSLFSCAYIGVPKHIKQGFTYCYNEEKTDIKELINIDGYFVMGTPSSSSLAFMFYEDGSFLYEFFDVDEERRKAGNPNISLYFQEIINDSTGKISSSFYKWFKWGLYIVEGDTIKAQYVNNPLSISPNWNAWEVWYKVINRNTIVEIYSTPIHYMSESDWENWEKNKKQREKTIVPAKFIPVGEKPIPNFWLKEEDWFWCEKRKVK
jgi:hypothetical protein